MLTKTGINALSNKELKSNLRCMVDALETGKKCTWQYAIAINNIVKGEQFTDDFSTLKEFADYINSTKGTISQYANAVDFMEREQLFPTMQNKKGDFVINWTDIPCTVYNAYLLSTLSENDYHMFYNYCECNDIDILRLSQAKLKATMKAWKDSIIDEKQEQEQEQEQEKTTIEVDTYEKAMVAIVGLMKRFDITLDDIATQIDK